jgi:hypothetical protein
MTKRGARIHEGRDKRRAREGNDTLASRIVILSHISGTRVRDVTVRRRQASCRPDGPARAIDAARLHAPRRRRIQCDRKRQANMTGAVVAAPGAIRPLHPPGRHGGAAKREAAAHIPPNGFDHSRRFPDTRTGRSSRVSIRLPQYDGQGAHGEHRHAVGNRPIHG